MFLRNRRGGGEREREKDKLVASYVSQLGIVPQPRCALTGNQTCSLFDVENNTPTN